MIPLSIKPFLYSINIFRIICNWRGLIAYWIYNLIALQADRTHQKSRKNIKKCVKDLNLTEIWRHLNPNKREYSCFSNTHTTYSRNDYFVVSSNLLSKIERCWYDSILLSDHAPISLTMQFSNLKPTPFRFRF